MCGPARRKAISASPPNWDNRQVPDANSAVRIGAGASVIVTQQETNHVDSLSVAAGATLDLTSGYFAVDNQNVGSTNDGSLLAETGTTLFLAGSLVNTGLLALYGGTLQTNGRTMTLSGGGAVTLRNAAIGRRDASGAPLAYDTFTNVDNVITGSGTIGRAGLLFPVNFVNQENANAVASNGTLQISGAVVNDGILGASDNGTLDLLGSFDQTTGGRIVALGTNALVRLDGGSITGGSLTATGASIIEVAANETLTGVTLFGKVVVDAGKKLTLVGDIYGEGSTIDATAGAIDLTAARLHGGTVKLPAGQSLNGLFLDGGTGGLNISGGSIGNSQTVSIHGSIVNTTVFTLESSPGYGSATLLVSGTAKLSGGGTVVLRSVPGGGDYLANINGTTSADVLAVASAVTNTGVIEAKTGDVKLAGLVSGGTLQVDAGGRMTLGGGMQGSTLAFNGTGGQVTVATS